MFRGSTISIASLVASACFAEPASTTDTPAESSSSAASTGTSTADAESVGPTSAVESSSDGGSTIGGESSGGSSTGSAECIPVPDDVVAWWRADGDFTDAIGPNDGAPLGGAALSRDGWHGGAMQLDGIDGAVEIGNGDELHFGLDAFTVEAWVRQDGATAPDGTTSTMPGDLTIAAKMSASASANADGWRLFKQQQDEFWFCFGSDANGCGESESTTVRTASGSPSVGQWVHLAAVHDGMQIRIYRDGQLEDSRAMRAPINTDTASLYLGGSTSEPGRPLVNALFYGAIDEVALYGRALDEDEIFELATSGLAKCEP